MISTQQPQNDAEIPPKRVTIDDIIPLSENVAIQYSANKEQPEISKVDDTKSLKLQQSSKENKQEPQQFENDENFDQQTKKSSKISKPNKKLSKKQRKQKRLAEEAENQSKIDFYQQTQDNVVEEVQEDKIESIRDEGSLQKEQDGIFDQISQDTKEKPEDQIDSLDKKLELLQKEKEELQKSLELLEEPLEDNLKLSPQKITVSKIPIQNEDLEVSEPQNFYQEKEIQEEQVSNQEKVIEQLENELLQNQAQFDRQSYYQTQAIENVLQIDQKVMNFSSFLPGKMLGSNLVIGNTTDYEQIIELSVDANSYKYNINDIFDQYPETLNVIDSDDASSQSLPFSLKTLPRNSNGSKKESMVNSEMKHQSWYIENPVSKELTKRITLKLGPNSQQDFVIVVKSPFLRKPENMLSIINVGLLTYKGEKFGVEESFEQFLAVQYKNNMKEFLADRKQLSQIQRNQILLSGRIVIPKLICQKEILHTQTKCRIIPLAVKNGMNIPLQKFRIPFKNVCSQELEIEFQFMKTCSSFDKRQMDFSISQQASPLELSANPTMMKVAPNTVGLLNIQAKLKNSFLLKQQEEGEMTQRKSKEVYNHMLIGRIKDTNNMFSFIIQGSLVDFQNQNQMLIK